MSSVKFPCVKRSLQSSPESAKGQIRGGSGIHRKGKVMQGKVIKGHEEKETEYQFKKEKEIYNLLA